MAPRLFIDGKECDLSNGRLRGVDGDVYLLEDPHLFPPIIMNAIIVPLLCVKWVEWKVRFASPYGGGRPIIDFLLERAQLVANL